MFLFEFLFIHYTYNAEKSILPLKHKLKIFCKKCTSRMTLRKEQPDMLV